MAGSARVKSIEALQAVSAAMQCFRSDAASALDDLDMEIRRAVEWIGVECREYWKQEVHRSWDRVTEAKRQLERAMMFREIDGHRPSCIEEKKAVAAAKRRLEVAQARVAAISRWVVAIDRAVNEFRGIRSHLVNWLDSDFPKAVAALSRMISALESYVRLEMPVDESSAVAGTAAMSPDTAPTTESHENNPDK